MNYGIGNGGGFGMSIPLNGFGTNQSFAPYQSQSWKGMQGGTWTQSSMGYSQPAYGQPSGWNYSQPTNHGWSTLQPTSWPGQAYVQPQHSMPFTPGCGNCGHTKPVIRRDW